jgi:hypothetical protein
VVALLPVTWVVVTPFAVAAVVAGAPAANRFVARHLWPVVTVGWIGAAMVAAGAFAAHGPARALLLGLGAPLCGLAFWMQAGGREPGAAPDDEDEPGPPTDEIDWDRFLDDVARWRRERDRDRVLVS